MTPTRILLAMLAAVAPLVAADEHAGHDHAAHAHGEATSLGSVAIGQQQVALSAAGALKAGGELHIELLFKPAAPAPKAVRVWIGPENGRGSAKAKAEMEAPGEYAAHVEVPAALAADHLIWISIEPEAGESAKASVALPKAK